MFWSWQTFWENVFLSHELVTMCIDKTMCLEKCDAVTQYFIMHPTSAHVLCIVLVNIFYGLGILIKPTEEVISQMEPLSWIRGSFLPWWIQWLPSTKFGIHGRMSPWIQKRTLDTTWWKQATGSFSLWLKSAELWLLEASNRAWWCHFPHFPSHPVGRMLD